MPIRNPLQMPSLKVHTCGEGAWNEENGDDKVHQMSNDLEWGKMTNIYDGSRTIQMATSFAKCVETKNHTILHLQSFLYVGLLS